MIERAERKIYLPEKSRKNLFSRDSLNKEADDVWFKANHPFIVNDAIEKEKMKKLIKNDEKEDDLNRDLPDVVG